MEECATTEEILSLQVDKKPVFNFCWPSDSNPELEGWKLKRYLCAMPIPPINRLNTWGTLRGRRCTTGKNPEEIRNRFPASPVKFVSRQGAENGPQSIVHFFRKLKKTFSVTGKGKKKSGTRFESANNFSENFLQKLLFQFSWS